MRRGVRGSSALHSRVQVGVRTDAKAVPGALDRSTVAAQGRQRRRCAMMATPSPMVVTNLQQATAPPRVAPPQEIAPDLLLHRSFVNTYALRTEVGLLLIDPGLSQYSRSVHAAVRAWSA